MQRAQWELGGEPNVGRKLAPLLKQAGFDAILTETQPFLGAGPEIEYLAETLLPSLNLYLPEAERAAGQCAINDLRLLALDPRATFYHFWFAVSGRNP